MGWPQGQGTCPYLLDGGKMDGGRKRRAERPCRDNGGRLNPSIPPGATNLVAKARPSLC